MNACPNCGFNFESGKIYDPTYPCPRCGKGGSKKSNRINTRLYQIAAKIVSEFSNKCIQCGKFRAEKELPSGEMVCPRCYEKYQKTLCFYCKKPGIWRTNLNKYICEKCFPLIIKPMEEGCICDYCGQHRADRIDRKTGMKLCPDCLRKIRINEEKREDQSPVPG